jgi:membrane protein implicated in regulation of membrane protease activity
VNQTRLSSLIEATVNTAIGFVVALVSQFLLFPLVGIHVSMAVQLELVTYFTIVSVVRSYVLRRWFNARLKAAAQRIAEKAS